MITRFFFKLFGVCVHKWWIHKTVKVVDMWDRRIATEYHLKCEKCGNMKVKLMP